MDRLDAIQMFMRVVESGSFSTVARQRGIGQPAVSKQIAALEAHLGAQLLRRTSRSLTLTEAGQASYEAAVRLAEDLEAAEASGAKTFVYVSAAGVIMDDRGSPIRGADESEWTCPNSFSGYLASKAQGEAAVLAADKPGFRTIALRPPAIWGPIARGRKVP